MKKQLSEVKGLWKRNVASKPDSREIEGQIARLANLANHLLM